MHSRAQLANVIDQILISEKEKSLDRATVEEYKKLNEKCDAVIEKIKERKNKKTSQQTGE